MTLYRTLTHDGPTVHIPVYDDAEANAGSFQLLIELEHFSPTGDEVEVMLDGAVLGSANRPKRQCRGPGRSRVGGREQLACLGPQSHPVRQRARTKSRSFSQGATRASASPIVVNNVEFWVTYE